MVPDVGRSRVVTGPNLEHRHYTGFSPSRQMGVPPEAGPVLCMQPSTGSGRIAAEYVTVAELRRVITEEILVGAGASHRVPRSGSDCP